jgi:hypothetical protein
MEKSNPETWAAALAQRLKVIQNNWVEEDSGARRDQIRREISEHLDGISEGERPAYLMALQAHFPDGLAMPGAEPVKAPVEAAPMGPREACAHLLETLKDASDRDKAAVATQLRKSALLPLSGPDTPGADELTVLYPELQRRLALRAGAGINSKRVLKVLLHLLETFIGMDDLLWNLWRQIAPNAQLRRKTRKDARQLIGAYLTNDPSVSYADVTDSMEWTRKLNTSILSSTGPVGRNFSKRCQDRFSPEAIRKVVEIEGHRRLLESNDVRCWKKYETLAGDMSETVLTQQLVEILTTYVEDIMLKQDPHKSSRDSSK